MSRKKRADEPRKPGLRIEGGKRTNLVKQRLRRKANRDARLNNAGPVEDTRVADAWQREDGRERARQQASRQRQATDRERSRSKKELRSVKVRNPYHQREHKVSSTNPLEIEAQINVKESAIETLFDKGSIDRAHKEAADHFRRLWESAGGKGAGAIDYSQVRVDGGRNAEDVPTRLIDASKDLLWIKDVLVKAFGEYSYRIIVYVCGQGLSLHDMTETRRQRDTMTDMLKKYLDLMAETWGYRTNAQRTVRRVRKSVDTRA